MAGLKHERRQRRLADDRVDFLLRDVALHQFNAAGADNKPMVDVITAPDFDQIIETLANPAIRIVSMTITEGGYFIDPATGKFDPNHPAIVAVYDTGVADARSAAACVQAGIGTLVSLGLIDEAALAEALRSGRLACRPVTARTDQQVPLPGRKEVIDVFWLPGTSLLA